MKLLVFAHKPPPHHGQSYMVQLLLDSLGGHAQQKTPSSNIQLYHLDCRLSSSLEDIGRMRFRKLLLIAQYCLQAIVYRFHYRVTNFYFIPATPNRAPLYRDWLVMALCRPFFRKIIFHWHAVGLGEWLETKAQPWERWLSNLLLSEADLSIVLADFNRADAAKLRPKQIALVPNGIPDPCPGFEREVLPARLARATALKEAVQKVEVLQVLFLSLCYSEKGLFDTVEAISLANKKLQGTLFRLKLTVAGTFFFESEKAQFNRRIQQPDLIERGERSVEYVGFASGDEKRRLLRESDCICFPTWYSAESFGLVLVEAMAFGLPIITTRWRAIPELLPNGYDGIVDPHSPEQIAAKLVQLPAQEYDPRLREHFLKNFTLERFAEQFRAALGQL